MRSTDQLNKQEHGPLRQGGTGGWRDLHNFPQGRCESVRECVRATNLLYREEHVPLGLGDAGRGWGLGRALWRGGQANGAPHEEAPLSLADLAAA